MLLRILTLHFAIWYCSICIVNISLEVVIFFYAHQLLLVKVLKTCSKTKHNFTEIYHLFVSGNFGVLLDQTQNSKEYKMFYIEID